jgi:hypothetical protein
MGAWPRLRACDLDGHDDQGRQGVCRRHLEDVLRAVLFEEIPIEMRPGNAGRLEGPTLVRQREGCAAGGFWSASTEGYRVWRLLLAERSHRDLSEIPPARGRHLTRRTCGAGD